MKEGEFDLVNFIYTGSLGRLDEPESITELMSWPDKMNCVCAMNDKPVIQKEDLICWRQESKRRNFHCRIRTEK